MAYCVKCASPATPQIPSGDDRVRLVCTNVSCGHIHYDNPKVICGALVVHGDKVLLCKRAIEPRYGYWTLPAGFMELGETMAQGSVRETLEEAEAIALAPQLYCIYDIPNIGQIYMLYACQLQDGRFGAGVESLECALFDEADIPWDDLAFEAVRRTLHHYFIDRRHHAFDALPLHQECIDKDPRLTVT